jgi:hypothetical protein
MTPLSSLGFELRPRKIAAPRKGKLTRRPAWWMLDAARILP